jgi:hypothetical protein
VVHVFDREPLFSTAVKSHAMISTYIATAMAAIIHDNLASGPMLPSSPKAMRLERLWLRPLKIRCALRCLAVLASARECYK